MPLPAAVVPAAGVALKTAGRFALKWAPYYAAKWGAYVAMREYGVGRTYRRLVRRLHAVQLVVVGGLPDLRVLFDHAHLRLIILQCEANRILMEDPVDRKHVQGVIRVGFGYLYGLLTNATVRSKRRICSVIISRSLGITHEVRLRHARAVVGGTSFASCPHPVARTCIGIVSANRRYKCTRSGVHVCA